MPQGEAFNRIGQTRYGQLIYNKNDVYIGRSIEQYREYSQREIVVFDQILSPGQVVVEVGANIGAHTLFFAKKVGPEGRVIAMEPQRLLFQMLCGSMALNCVTNVHCWNMAAGAEQGEIAVPQLDYTQPDNFGGVSLGDYADGERVPLVTLDSMELPRCDFLKIDVAGMEADVLRGAAQTISRHKPILYVESAQPEKEASLVQLLDSLGYTMYWHLPPLFNADNFAASPDNVFGDTVSKNLLCIDKAADSRLTGFTPVKIADAA